MVQTKHLEYVDLAKGIGILLVILGHGMFPNHFLLDSFHMPMFFILTGITLTPPTKFQVSKQWFLKKTERIFIPYIFFMVVSGICELLIGRSNPHSPFNSPLWFLQTLYCALIIYYFLSVCLQRKLITIICCIIAVSTYFVYKYTHIPSVLPFNLFRALVALVFIHIGVITSQAYKKHNLRSSILVEVISSLTFITVFGSIMNETYVEGVNFYTGSVFTFNVILPWILAISGSMMILYLSKIINRVSFLNWLGKNSLVIMCVHFPFIERLNVLFASIPFYQTITGKMGLALAEFVLTIAFSCVMVYACKRFLPKLTGYNNSFLTK